MPDYDRIPEQAKEREAIIRKSYRKARAMGDKNVHFIAGKTLFGKEDRVICTVDNVHPNDLGFYRMAKKIYSKMKQIDKKFQ